MNAEIYSSPAELKKALPHKATFTLVGGCFDLIHVGHLHLLKFAADLQDLLVVAVLSDAYVRNLKGAQRPIIPENQRAEMVASIRYVDYVYIANESPTSIESLDALKPSAVVFDESSRGTEKLRERMCNISLTSPETRIIFLPRYEIEPVSTSAIIEAARRTNNESRITLKQVL